ncbi:flavin reductase family protein [Pseudacidovorax intermedius]|uniref:Asp/Glu/hydantoin racemase n=1 Tax=Pseudacidovorax intermedius TaxID=433924 RepID=A0A147GRK4_9BURK|nr:flavin reductase family protein [Pseudacidovorax intermedius]KTT18953.1 Asp/Glu/hydantoin racemase [Pseudacidovorax intermedius]
MDDRYFYEPRHGHGLAHNPIASIVGPRPIGWISTVGEDGRLNLAPYSFFGIFNYAPPIVAFASDGVKDSLANALRLGEFVVNTVTEELAEAMNVSSTSARKDEFVLAGLASAPSRLLRTPRVARSPVALECRVIEGKQLRDVHGDTVDSWLLMGEVVGVSVDSRLVASGTFDWTDIRRVLRAGGPSDYHWVGSENLMRMRRPG